MASNKNAMIRYRILEELLSDQHHNYTLDDLTSEVSSRLSKLNPNSGGITRRTIERDLFYLENEWPHQAEIERYSVPTGNDRDGRSAKKLCLRFADPTYSIFRNKFSNDEKHILKSLLSILSGFDGMKNLNLESLKKLQMTLESENCHRKIISFANKPIENSKLFGQLFTAISHKQVVRLKYHRTCETCELIHSVKAYPYMLKEYNLHWYLIASAENGDVICLRVEQIDKVVTLLHHTYSDYTGDLDRMIDDAFIERFCHDS